MKSCPRCKTLEAIISKMAEEKIPTEAWVLFIENALKAGVSLSIPTDKLPNHWQKAIAGAQMMQGMINFMGGAEFIQKLTSKVIKKTKLVGGLSKEAQKKLQKQVEDTLTDPKDWHVD
jgi:hypothetical protein